ncbi:unnamed protein product [Adineta steineri]|uniref:CHHC U11-48K-type domain-containing protein n=1 Tax=Adineta steineri TaxID=433720 RepID=A0A818TFB7_9BILA|nr:unnamed protein product [Adineta steineri]CAF3676739.1 unnamed protein product [Adineta steineri]
MSNLYLCPDDFWRCPIDLNHQVLAKRFQYHIRRCMIANPHIHRVRCVFNASHLTTPSNLLAHMSTCPDALTTSTVLIGLSDIPPGRPWSDNCHRSSLPTDWRMFQDVNANEDWDDDIRERRAKSAANSEQTMNLSSIQTSTPSLCVTHQLDDTKQEEVDHDIYKLKYTEDISQMIRKNDYKSVAVNKQALVFEEHDNDGQIHPAETDDINKNLMKIRTLQLIGGAGRGKCCLLRTTPPVRVNIFSIIIIIITVVQLQVACAKICYQCDDKNPSSKLKFIGEKITKCNGVPFEKYATKTSRAFGAAVLTCYTKFNETGGIVKRGAFGLGETYDKNFKCRDRFHVCCRTAFCNKHAKAPCPPTPKATTKKEVKACYQCKGAENCKPEKLDGSEIRTSGAFGGKNLYCFTKFDPKTGIAVARGGFGFGESIDKNLKCDAKHYLCCYDNLCNNQTAGFCAKPK